VNPITSVQDLSGGALIGVICVLLFLEETGVPLPFAPGDIVLAITGIAIAGGRVNAGAMVAALTVAVIVGAIIGHQLAAMLGWQRLMRIAEPLHARKPLERAADLLQRGGWRAVFTARLVPGLRVYTTQVAGVSRVPLSTFITGLVPSVVVYLAAFIGLGVAFGRPVLTLIHNAEHQLFQAILWLALLAALILLSRAPVRRGLAALQAAGWTGPLRFSLDQVGLSLILGCIGLNFAGHAIAQALGLPLFLDSTGTILAGVAGGPWIGACIGVISNLIAANSIDPIAAPYAIVSFMIGFTAGLSRYLNWQRRLSGWISLWVVCVAIAALGSTPLNFLMNGGRSGVDLGDSIYAALLAFHVPGAVAAFVGETVIDLPDKLVTVVAALLIAQSFTGQRTADSPKTELDLVEAFTFVVRSKRWGRRLLASMLCLLFFWLVVPYLLLTGYIVRTASAVQNGTPQLPEWTRRWRMVFDGLKINLALGLWLLPGVLLSVPAAVVSAIQERPGSAVAVELNSVAGIIAGLGSVWIILVLLVEAPIVSTYLDRGLAGAVNPRTVIARFRRNVGLAIVVGALIVVLTVIGVIGLAAVLIGVVLTLPYASLVGAYLVGIYARQTATAVTPSGDRKAEPKLA
jgi:energy-coupling factor transport system substrate-specific component